MNKVVKIVGGVLGAVGLGFVLYKALSKSTPSVGMEVKDAEGNVIGTTQADGTVKDAAGKIVGAISDAGKVIDVAGSVIGQVIGKDGNASTGGPEEVVTPGEGNAILYISRQDADHPEVTEIRVGQGSTGVFNPGDMVRVNHPELKGDFMVTEFADAENPLGGWVRLDTPFSKIKTKTFPGWANPIAPSNWDSSISNVKPLGSIAVIGEADATFSASGKRKKARPIFKAEAAARKILQQQGKKRGLVGKALRQYIRANAKAEAAKHKNTPPVMPPPRGVKKGKGIKSTIVAGKGRGMDGWQS